MNGSAASGGRGGATPHPSAFGRHLLPQGEKENHTSGFSSPSMVGISSDTVGWMCTARWITV